MVKRSTRNRLKCQVLAVANDLERALEHLKNVDLYADGRSPDIEKTIPKFVVVLNAVRNMVIRWHDRL